MRCPCLRSALQPERPDAPGELSDTIGKLQERGAGLAVARSMPRSLALLAAVLGFTPSVFAQVSTPGAAPAGAQASAATPSPAGPAATAQPARVSTGLVTIESDLQRADQLTGVVTATGNVRIVYRDERVVATARQAQYFSKENRVVLSGDVDIVQEGGNLIRAERVVYLVDGERLIAIPPDGQQVFSRLKIQQQQTPPATAVAPATASPAAATPAPKGQASPAAQP
jgi:lipopolysaccharide export system protein LptA